MVVLVEAGRRVRAECPSRHDGTFGGIGSQEGGIICQEADRKFAEEGAGHAGDAIGVQGWRDSERRIRGRAEIAVRESETTKSHECECSESGGRRRVRVSGNACRSPVKAFASPAAAVSVMWLTGNQVK